MRIIFLGTGAASPTPRRNVSGLAIRSLKHGYWWMFDCGEGTQHRVLRTSLALPSLTHIFLSHLDGDHCFGLPGLLLSRALQGGEGPMQLYGFRPLKSWIETTLSATSSHLSYDLDIHAVHDGLVCEIDNFRIECQFFRHRGPTAAYAITEAAHEGHFKAEKAQELGIPFGPLYGKLKRGETIQLPDGREFHGRDFIEPPRPGRKITVVGDIAADQVALPLAEGSDVLIHEATFLERLDGDLALKTGHSTAASAGRTAREAGAKTLVLSHISPRYDAPDAAANPSDLKEEAQREHPGGKVIVARDLMEMTLPVPK